MNMYRQAYMPSQECIGITPSSGYYGAPKHEQSLLAGRYIAWLNEKRRSKGEPLIEDGWARKEHMICGYKVDGYVPQTCKVFEINGCKFHAHDCHLGGAGGRMHPLYGVSFDKVRHKMELRLWKIKQSDLASKVSVFWECNIHREIATVRFFSMLQK